MSRLLDKLFPIRRHVCLPNETASGISLVVGGTGLTHRTIKLLILRVSAINLSCAKFSYDVGEMHCTVPAIRIYCALLPNKDK